MLRTVLLAGDLCRARSRRRHGRRGRFIATWQDWIVEHQICQRAITRPRAQRHREAPSSRRLRRTKVATGRVECELVGARAQTSQHAVRLRALREQECLAARHRTKSTSWSAAQFIPPQLAPRDWRFAGCMVQPSRQPPRATTPNPQGCLTPSLYEARSRSRLGACDVSRARVRVLPWSSSNS